MKMAFQGSSLHVFNFVYVPTQARNMEQNTANGTESEIGILRLSEIVVVLVDESNNPSVLNPDYLLSLGISEEKWTVENSISTPMYSEVEFNHGLSLRSTPNRVLVGQEGNSLIPEEIGAPKVAKNYIHSLPYSKCSAIGLNFTGYREWSGSLTRSVSDALRDRGEWLSFQGAKPEVELKARFQQQSRAITLTVSVERPKQLDAVASEEMRFRANFRHDIEVENEDSPLGTLDSVLDSWQSVLAEFSVLTDIFQPLQSKI